MSDKARSTRRTRRTNAEMDQLRYAIYEAVEADRPMTVRQVFYRLVSSGIIDKTEAEYKNTVCRLLADMRRSGVIPYGWIADNTRWMRKPNTHNSLEDALRTTAEAYRRSLWNHLSTYVEVWCEKDALAGVLYEETAAWDVPLMVTRGYPSLSYLAEAAEAIKAHDKPTWLYYLGDHDPSGVDIPRVVHERLQEMAPEAEINFTRLAVNPDQIKAWDLPTRPTKKSDSRSKSFKGQSVELDAIPSRQLRAIVREAVTGHIDRREYDMLQLIEMKERDTLMQIAGGLNN